MPIGSRLRAPGRGFTYLWLMFLLAIGAALLADAGSRWSTTLRREREQELLFRGRQIAAAIAAYHAASGVPVAQWPRSLDELVEDRRGAQVQRHLRRVWSDPFTGLSDWEPVLDADGGWQGVHSRSDAVALLVPETGAPAAARRWRVSEHRFMAPAPAVAASAPATSAAASEPVAADAKKTSK